MNGPLYIKNGVIYTSPDYRIDNMAVVINETGGLIRYGDAEDYMDYYYQKMVDDFQQKGLCDLLEHTHYIKFDQEELTVEDICTFVNYMIFCSANGLTIMKILNSNKEEMIKAINRLREISY